jgi:hypothetical protein
MCDTHMVTHRFPEIKCLACGTKLNSASDDNDGDIYPSEDDFTVCLYCTHIMAFKADRTLRELTLEEAKDAETDQAVMDIVGMVQLYQRIYGKDKRN